MNLYFDVHLVSTQTYEDLCSRYELDGRLIVLHGDNQLCSGEHGMNVVFYYPPTTWRPGESMYVMSE